VQAAINAGATHVIIIPTAVAETAEAPRHPLALAQHAFGLAIERRNAVERSHPVHGATVSMLPIPRTDIGPLDFGHAEELIELGRRSAHAWLRDHRPVRPILDLTQPITALSA
jgi:hypothetical protein